MERTSKVMPINEVINWFIPDNCESLAVGGTNVPVPPALANAIYDAVGIRIESLAITRRQCFGSFKATSWG